jgi:hypothetical protein
MQAMSEAPRKLIDPAEIGKKGGLSRAKSLTKKQRSESASNAAKARWADKKKKKA